MSRPTMHRASRDPRMSTFTSGFPRLPRTAPPPAQDEPSFLERAAHCCVVAGIGCLVVSALALLYYAAVYALGGLR